MATQCKSNAINTYRDFEASRVIAPGMLSSPQIAYCLKKFNILDGFDLKCLGSATYHMRIGGEVLTWVAGEKVEFILGERDDDEKNIKSKLVLRPNSLTFVTTIEQFRLPKDIIARFNLKSKHVHRGLLLGTGPIVDPELNAKLLIPLHNFSSNDVLLKWGDELISVEFTKTSDPDANILDSSFRYVCNPHWDYDFDKYRRRIGYERVESSVSSTFEKYEKSIREYEEALSQSKEEHRKELQDSKQAFETFLFKFQVGSVIAAVVAVATIIGVFYSSFSLLSSTFEQLNHAENLIKEYKNKDVDLRAFALASDQNDLKKKLSDLEGNIRRIGELQTVFENNQQRLSVKNAQMMEDLREQLGVNKDEATTSEMNQSK